MTGNKRGYCSTAEIWLLGSTLLYMLLVYYNVHGNVKRNKFKHSENVTF